MNAASGKSDWVVAEADESDGSFLKFNPYIAVVTNTIPNTGISLPFFSSGGTSLMMLLGEMGIVLSVSRGEM